MGDRAVTLRGDFNCGVQLAGSGAADQQWLGHPTALHFRGDPAHLPQAWRDQAGKPDHVGALCLGAVENLGAGHHHAKIDHFIVVTTQHHADDILADVVHVTLHRRHDDTPGGLAHTAFLLGVHERFKMGHGAFHHPRALDHLRQKHPPGAEQITDHGHTIHQRAFDHVERAIHRQTRLLGVFNHMVGDAVHQGMNQPAGDVAFAPFRIALHHLGRVTELFRDLKQAFPGIGPAVQHGILDTVA